MKIMAGFLTIFIIFNTLSAVEHRLVSPDNKIRLDLSFGESIRIGVYRENHLLFSASDIMMEIEGIQILGKNPQVIQVQNRSVNQVVKPVLREKFSEIKEIYNELRIDFKGGYSQVWRAYNSGVAYQFLTDYNDDITVRDEFLEISFQATDSIYFQPSSGFASAYETPYQHLALASVNEDGLLCLPALVKTEKGVNVLITESGLVDYPGMWLKGTKSEKLRTDFAGVPLERVTEGNPYQKGRVARHADYIARTAGKRSFPWRVFAIGPEDKDLLTNQLVYLLAPDLRLSDVSWIRPGIMTFDWWARRNIYGVDFKAGINTATAKYFIDFAADFGLEYFLFDDGWTDNDDILNYNRDLAMEEIAAYAKEKNVGLMVWLIWSSLERQFDQVFDMLEEWGVRGIKVDFMNRDDQEMVNFYYRVAAEAARRHMVVNFHGAYKPAGLRRAYPNVLTREALIEFEYNGWTDHANPVHHNLLPFIRMVAGPMDYIPGTMNNAQKKDFRPNGDYPMGQGTRAHAIALFVVLESPMQMLPDAPSDYYRERECMSFISQIPVEWDETRILEAKIGEYVVLARRNGKTWFISAITNWTPRIFDVSLDFLPEGLFSIEIIRDGLNADLRAIDYVKETGIVENSSRYQLNLAAGGGWIAKISPK